MTWRVAPDKETFRVRVAVTNDLHANGGAMGLLAHRYTRALIDAGHDATLVTGIGTDAPPQDIPVAGWRYPERTDESPLGMVRFYRKLRARSADAFARWYLEKPTRPDLWIALVIPSALGALDAGGRRIPLLYNCNSPWAMEWLAARRAVTGMDAQGLSRMIGVWPRRRAERTIVKRARAWFALSQLQLDWFSSEHRSCARIEKVVFPGAVDSDIFRPLSADERADVRQHYDAATPESRLIVCSRRLVPRTGIDTLLRATATLASAPAGQALRVIITGDGPERAALEALARELNVASRATFTGFIAMDELRRLTAAADVAVLPTKELEGFGLAAVEALSCGTPVVATPVGGLVEVVGGLDKRFLTRDTGHKALAATLMDVLQEPAANGHAWRKRCREYVVSRYSWNMRKGEFVSLCERCAKRN